jgi:hypothetical protein
MEAKTSPPALVFENRQMPYVPRRHAPRKAPALPGLAWPLSTPANKANENAAIPNQNTARRTSPTGSASNLRSNQLGLWGRRFLRMLHELDRYEGSNSSFRLTLGEAKTRSVFGTLPDRLMMPSSNASKHSMVLSFRALMAEATCTASRDFTLYCHKATGIWSRRVSGHAAGSEANGQFKEAQGLRAETSRPSFFIPAETNPRAYY